MATVRFIGDEPREVSILPDGLLRLVHPDTTFEVPKEYLESYWCQPHYYETPGYDGPRDEELSEPPEPPETGKPVGAAVTEKTTTEKAGD